MCNKPNEIVDYVKDHNVDVLAMTEIGLEESAENNIELVVDITADGISLTTCCKNWKKGVVKLACYSVSY